MSKMSRLRPLAIALSAISFLAVQPSFAQQSSTSTRIRGTIESVGDNVITVKARDGSVKTIDLANDVRIRDLNKLTQADIKPGLSLAITGTAQDDGSQKALFVVVFPEGTTIREVFMPWDLGPKSTMTNATATPNTVKSTDGQILTVTQKAGDKKILLTNETQIATAVPGTKADLKPGAAVLVNVTTKDAGKLEANAVSVGRDGIVPM